MSLFFELRPPKHVPVGAPVSYFLQTQAHVLEAGTFTSYFVKVNSLPPSGARLRINNNDFTFLTAADGYSPDNPLHVSLEGTADQETIARRLYDAINTNVRTVSEFIAVAFNFFTAAQFNVSSAQPGPLPNTTGLAPDGTPYTNLTTDPIGTQLVGGIQGNAPVFREGFAVHLDVLLEDGYRHAPTRRALPRLRIPAPAAEGIQRFAFDLAGVVRLPLGFDLPAPTHTGVQVAGKALRKGHVRAFISASDPTFGNRFVEDLDGDTPYSFFVLNAEADAFAALPKPQTTNGCPTGVPTASPQLAAFFEPNAGRIQWLTRHLRQRAVPDAPAYLSFFSAANHPDLSTPANLRLRVLLRDTGAVLESALDFTQALDCNATPWTENLWTVPLQSLWAELGLKTATRVEIYLYGTTTGGAVTNALRWEVLPPCAPPRTLLYQNALGVPETFPVSTDAGEVLLADRNEARANLRRFPAEAAQPRESFSYDTRYTDELRFTTFQLAAWERPKLKELLQSPSVFLLEDTPDGLEWVPVVLTENDYSLADPRQASTTFRFRVRRSRRPLDRRNG